MDVRGGCERGALVLGGFWVSEAITFGGSSFTNHTLDRVTHITLSVISGISSNARRFRFMEIFYVAGAMITGAQVRATHVAPKLQVFVQL